MMPWDRKEFPVVATNDATGQQIRVDIGERLRAAINAAIDQAVADRKPKFLPHNDYADAVLLQGAVVDVAVGVVAAWLAVFSPRTALTATAWVVAASVWGKTLCQYGIARWRER